MFLSKLFSIFKKKKEPEQQTSDGSNPKSGTAATPGTIAGGTSASAGASDPNASQPSQPNPLADSGQQTNGGNIADSQSPDMSGQNDIGNVAQADGAPAYPGEDSPSDTSSGSETTDTVTPETDSYQSGSTDDSAEEPKLPSDDSSPQQPEGDSGSTESDDGIGASGSDDQTGGSAGPSIG